MATDIWFSHQHASALQHHGLPLVNVSRRQRFTAGFHRTVRHDFSPHFLPHRVRPALNNRFLTNFQRRTGIHQASTLNRHRRFFNSTRFRVRTNLRRVLRRRRITLLGIPAIFARVRDSTVNTHLFHIRHYFSQIQMAHTTNLARNNSIISISTGGGTVTNNRKDTPRFGSSTRDVQKSCNLQGDSQLADKQPPGYATDT